MKGLIICAAILLILVSGSRADNWPQWRGPNGAGTSMEKNLPVVWSATENVRWKSPLPGPGMSSPIIWGDRVFITQSMDRAGKQRALICLNRKDGKQIWQRVTEFAGTEPTYDGEKHFCSATPATDGERVVAFFASAGLACYDMAGKKLWTKDLGRCEQIWGTAASPILYRDMVIQNFGPGERSFLIALNKRTGAEIWKIDMPGKFGATQPDWIGSWSTPIISRRDGRDELIMSWPDEVKAFDPRTGKLIWSSKGLGKLVYTSPIASQDYVVAMSGFGGPAVGIRRGGIGDITASHRLWHEEKAPQRIGSGVIHDGNLYRVNENGVVDCLNVETGKTLWSERVTGTTWSSLVHADGKLYLGSQRGEIAVIAAKPAYESLARNMMNERMQSSIAVSNGELFIRTYDHLWCIGTSK